MQRGDLVREAARAWDGAAKTLLQKGPAANIGGESVVWQLLLPREARVSL